MVCWIIASGKDVVKEGWLFDLVVGGCAGATVEGDRRQPIDAVVFVVGDDAVGLCEVGLVADGVVGVAGGLPFGVGDGLEPVQGVVGEGGAVAVAVHHDRAVAVGVVFVAGDVPLGVGDRPEPVEAVVGVGGGMAIGVGEGQEVARWVVGRDSGAGEGVGEGDGPVDPLLLNQQVRFYLNNDSHRKESLPITHRRLIAKGYSPAISLSLPVGQWIIRTLHFPVFS